MDPKRIVEEGYDALGPEFGAWAHHNPGEVRSWFLEEVLARVPPRADVLELGCGPGVDAPALSRGRSYTGVDLSEVQLSIARAGVPGGTFVKGDLTAIDLPDASFDAVVSLYVFNHVPRDEQGPTFLRAFEWLRPGGVLSLSLEAGGHDGEIERGWLGRVDMYFAGNDVADNERLLREAGFELELSETKTEEESGGQTVTFHWAIGRKPD